METSETENPEAVAEIRAQERPYWHRLREYGGSYPEPKLSER